MAVLLSVALIACSSSPRTPDWAINAHNALQRASEAYLSGEQRVANLEFERARREVARTGRADAVARVELARCAARFASLEMLPGAGLNPSDPAARSGETCAAFEPLRADAMPAERAYADWLGGKLGSEQLALLPKAQQPAAAARDGLQREAAIRAIEDPLSRLVASAAALRDGMAPPGLAAQAIETASAQGWRRPLLAWLTFELKRAQQDGDSAAASRLQRRIDLVGSSGLPVNR